MSNDFPYIFIDISSLSLGDYTYTLNVLDESGNLGTESVDVEVTDTNPPYIKRPLDIVYSQGTIGHTITWQILESNPKSYSLYLDSNMITSDITVEKNFTISVDSLNLGLHEYVLVVYDENDLSYSSTVYVAVVDISKPQISHIAECQFVSGDPNSELVWKVFDLNPYNYQIKVNNEVQKQDSWSSNEISLKLVGWSIGYYTVELTITDTSGNSASDEVIVNITEQEQFTTQASTGAPGFEFLALLFSLLVINLGFKRKTKLK